MSQYPTSPPYEVEQRCYRHADRRAGVTCQRCARPICPSCMVSASVGFQCPECAKEGASQQRLVDAWKAQHTPSLTYALVAVNVAIFVVGIAMGRDVFGRDRMLFDYGLNGGLVASGEWWRLITSGFLHAGVLHLAFNMFALYSLGQFLEGIVGRARYALIYGVSLLGGSLGVVLLGGQGLTVGASGAIFGVFGAFAVLEYSRGQNPFQSGIGTTILLNLFITFAVPGISIGGHLGGLVAGAAVGALLIGLTPEQARQRDRQVAQMGAAAAGLGILLLVAALAAAQAGI